MIAYSFWYCFLWFWYFLVRFFMMFAWILICLLGFVAKYFDGFDVFFECCLFFFSFGWMFGVFFRCFCCFVLYVVWWFLTCVLDSVFWLVLMCLAVFLVVARSWLFEVRVRQVDHEGINGFELPEPYHGRRSLQPLLNSLRWRLRGRETERCLLCPSKGISQLDATGGSSHGSFPGYRVTKEQISEANVFSIFHQFFVDMIFDECDSNK